MKSHIYIRNALNLAEGYMNLCKNLKDANSLLKICY
jgi:hypothetical protein